jgi:hypothetical protein
MRRLRRKSQAQLERVVDIGRYGSHKVRWKDYGKQEECKRTMQIKD